MSQNSEPRMINPDSKSEATWEKAGRYLSIRCRHCMNLVEIDPGKDYCPDDHTPIPPLSWRKYSIPIGEAYKK